MKKQKLFLLLTSISLLFLINSCEVDNCTCPTNNRMYSYFYKIYKNDWTDVEPFHWYSRINVPRITMATIDEGAVMVYYKNSVNTWVSLPYSTTLVNEAGTIYNEEVWSGFALGTVDIDYVYSNPLDATPPDIFEIKVVIINR